MALKIALLTVFSVMQSAFATTHLMPTLTEACERTYIVGPDDSLWKISERFQMRLSDLIRLNRNVQANPDTLFIDQRLCLSNDKVDPV